MRVFSSRFKWRPALLWGILLGACTSAASAEPSPFRVDPPEVDLGPTPRGQSPDRRIRIVNTTDREVRITRVNPECECVAVSVDGPPAMPPLGVIELSVTYETMRQPAGPTEKIITVEYEDRGRKEFEIPVRVDIQPGVQVEPSMLSLGDVAQAESRTIALQLRTPDGAPFSIGAAETSDDEAIRVALSAESNGAMRDRHRVSVTVGPFKSPGPFAGHVLLFARHWSDRELLVEVYAHVVGAISVSPTTIYRTGVRRGEQVEELLTFSGEGIDGASLRVRTASEPLAKTRPGLSSAEGKADQFRLTFTVPSDLAGTHVSGKLDIVDPGSEEVLARLTVFLYLQNGKVPE